MKTIRFPSVLFVLWFASGAWAQIPASPSWYDLKSRMKLVQAQAQKQGVATQMEMQKFDVQKFEMGILKLNLVTARFAPVSNEKVTKTTGAVGEGTQVKAKAKAALGYNLSEIYSESSQSPKLLFQLVDKEACESKTVEDISLKQLGFVDKMQIYFVQVQLRQPTCPNSVTNPRIFLVLQENKKTIKKVYQSDVSENGRYRVSFQKDIIRLEYAKNLNSESQVVELNWNGKTQKFEPALP